MHTGNISIEEVDMLMRLLGKKLKKSFFEDMVNEGFVDESGRLQFSELVEILSLWNVCYNFVACLSCLSFT